jgi:hypothetical protein
MRQSGLGLGLLAWLLLCPAAAAQPADPPYTAKWENGSAERARWTGFARDAVDELGRELWRAGFTPAGIEGYCPRYATATDVERKAFWVGLLSALAQFESNFRPETRYTENFKGPDGAWVISRGLLQLSFHSGNGYGCALQNAEQLHDPETNLRCAVRIMNRLVSRDGALRSTAAPWKGASRYWSPFRKAERRVAMANWTKAQPYCRAG